MAQAQQNPQTVQAPAEDENHIIAERRAKLAALRAAGVAYPNDFKRTDLFGDLTAKYGAMTTEELEAAAPEVACSAASGSSQSMASSFCTVRDFTGTMQYFVQQNEVGSDAYAAFKTFDLGDIVAAKGVLFRTHAGDLAIRVKEIRLMTKSIRPLPDKHKGLQDTELCYRQRYVDLIMNEESRNRFLTRSKAIGRHPRLHAQSPLP